MFAARFELNKELSDQAFELGLQLDPASDQRPGAEIAREVVWGDRKKAEALAAMTLFKKHHHLASRKARVKEWYDRILSADPPALEPDPSIPTVPEVGVIPPGSESGVSL
jgi:hypothetical protein